jgi:hypothetical protein
MTRTNKIEMLLVGPCGRVHVVARSTLYRIKCVYMSENNVRMTSIELFQGTHIEKSNYGPPCSLHAHTVYPSTIRITIGRVCGVPIKMGFYTDLFAQHI